MPVIREVGDLQIAEDMPFQERMWRAERIAWACFALLILAGLLGLFGGGPLSTATIERGPLRVAYNRFERFGRPGTLEVQIAPAASSETAEIWLPHAYLQQLEVTSIAPQPREVRDDGEGLIYIFDLSQPGQAARITFHIMPMRPGPLSGAVGSGAGEPARFTQFVYP